MKQKRQQRIIELITSQEIGTQEELADKLSEEGYKVTQATVSRDIRELKLSKASIDGNRQKYVIIYNETAKLNEKYQRAFKDGFVSVNRAMNMLVIKTFPGMAMALAAALDALEIPEILGSIAGDDTIMCATASEQDAAIVLEKIRNATVD